MSFISWINVWLLGAWASNNQVHFYRIRSSFLKWRWGCFQFRWKYSQVEYWNLSLCFWVVAGNWWCPEEIHANTRRKSIRFRSHKDRPQICKSTTKPLFTVGKKVFNANKLLCVNRTGLLKIPIYSNKMHTINKIFKRDMFYISQFSWVKRVMK